MTILLKANASLTSEGHSASYQTLVESPKPQNFSSKLYQRILHKEIELLSDNIVRQQTDIFHTPDTNVTVRDAGKAKVCYLASVCKHKIIFRLKIKDLRKLSNHGIN